LDKRHIADRGFLTFAVGEQYLRAARAQAMTVKLTQSNSNFAIIMDSTAGALIDQDDKALFDKIIVLGHTAQGWDMTCEWMAFNLSPWRETFKTDADMLFTTSIDHWWRSLQHRDICIARSVRDFRGDIITSRSFRRLFDLNNLPNAYSAMTYFRYSRGAADFYAKVKQISEDWAWYAKDLLVKNDDLRPRTDEMYALASMIAGPDATLSHVDELPTFVHMKEKLNGLGHQQPWHEQLPCYWRGDKLFVGNFAQQLPFHYHHKGALTDELYACIHRDYKELIKGARGSRS